ncbi:hypothetical protein [Glycomyces sp. YM15]|uniref:hypothetical protein n=1 Tax=Glycomyces sp. YM15 TaxID=2800446 RepID=UPI00196416EE|nr:hypothetical protein [Glycomyces sp. YM15]
MPEHEIIIKAIQDEPQSAAWLLDLDVDHSHLAAAAAQIERVVATAAALKAGRAALAA